MKKVAIIGSVGIPAVYGGFETLSEYLTKSLEGNKEYALTVFCSSKAYPIKKEHHNGAILKYIPLKANGFQSIPYDICSIARSIRKNDTLLILGVAGCFTIPFFKLFFKRKFIVNIDGVEWKREKWGRMAKWYLRTSERLAAKHADVIVADNEVIRKFVDREYNTNCVFIPYGANHVEKLALSDVTKDKYAFLNEEMYAFKVCRIEPENNIHLILEAFSQHTLPLVIVGNWNYSEYGKELYGHYKGIKNIHLIQPIYDQQELNQLRSNATVYLHGHSAGGTNPSLIEAMMLARNIIAFDVGYNRSTTQNKAAFFKDKDSLLKLLDKVLTNDLNNGEELKEVADIDYNWDEIAKRYSALF